MKNCIRCLESKNLSDFAMSSSNQHKDGFLNVCKVCTRKRSKELRQAKAQPKIVKVNITADRKKYARDYAKKRRKIPKVKISAATRGLISLSFKRALKGTYRKSDKTENILGCGLDFFINHLTKNFQEGMSLGNYGQWHIDHIKPLALAKNENDIYVLNHYSNLQPLWAIDNMKKGAKYN